MRVQNLNWRMASAGRTTHNGDLPSSLRGLKEDHRAMRFDSPDAHLAPRGRRSPQRGSASSRQDSCPAIGRVPAASYDGRPLSRKLPHRRGGQAAPCRVRPATPPQELAQEAEAQEGAAPPMRMKKTVSFSEMLEVEVPIFPTDTKEAPRRCAEDLARANMARLIANNDRVMRRWQPMRERLLGVAGCFMEGQALLIWGRVKRTQAGDACQRQPGTTRCGKTSGRRASV
uniref:Uncharacterized protein n=1 Tax=Pyrodinium bahamense TaxID=73915 RepID=A0A7R9ZW12_9DINO|mmetsp:Transcript_12250/g.33643  ORF Transcript_12250/g.33643 Transcript_12250/m.33643 type:complete len:229 (+) Transcript_12250:68-754(+)